MDILTGNGRSIQKKDFSSDWNLAPKLGKVGAADLNLALDPQTIAEVVRFDAAGNASVVGSIEYGSSLQLQFAPGRYGLSLFVEGDLISYSVDGNFQITT